jgi:hypothetical protein
MASNNFEASFLRPRASDQRARSQAQALRRRIHELDAVVLYGQNALAIPVPAQTLEVRATVLHPALDS